MREIMRSLLSSNLTVTGIIMFAGSLVVFLGSTFLLNATNVGKVFKDICSSMVCLMSFQSANYPTPAQKSTFEANLHLRFTKLFHPSIAFFTSANRDVLGPIFKY